MAKPIFTFSNNDNIKYSVYFGKTRFTYKKNGKTIPVRAYGTCEDPESKNPKIIIEKNLADGKELATAIEEFIHAFYWDKPEKEVRPLAKTLAKFLYERGWKKVKT